MLNYVVNSTKNNKAITNEINEKEMDDEMNDDSKYGAVTEIDEEKYF